MVITFRTLLLYQPWFGGNYLKSDQTHFCKKKKNNHEQGILSPPATTTCWRVWRLLEALFTKQTDHWLKTSFTKQKSFWLMTLTLHTLLLSNGEWNNSRYQGSKIIKTSFSRGVILPPTQQHCLTSVWALSHGGPKHHANPYPSKCVGREPSERATDRCVSGAYA